MRLRNVLVVHCTLLLLASLASAQNWPQFRGPTGQGICVDKNVPLHWSESTSIVWHTAIAGLEYSSPIIWGDRIFLTSATDEGKRCHVVCLKLQTGEILWDTEAFSQTTQALNARNSHATPTPVTDGQYVCAFFSSGKAIAVDFDGKPLWKNESLHYYQMQGMGGSPILCGDLLIKPWDHANQGIPKEPGWIKPWDKSYVLALDKHTGQERWRAMRGMTRASHVTPQVIEVEGQKQLISPAGDFVQAFDPDTGKKLWELHSEGETPVPSVVYGDGLLFTTSGFGAPTIRAIRPARVDQTTVLDASHIAWETTKSVPAMPSFVFADHLLFGVKDTTALASCYEAKTGKVLWHERIGPEHASYSASPLWANGRVYFLSEQGVTTVLSASDKFEVLATNSLPPGKYEASIAVSGGRFYIRSDTQLYCVEERP